MWQITCTHDTDGARLSSEAGSVLWEIAWFVLIQ